MATVKIYVLDDRNVNEYDSLSIMKGLLDGAYCYAGSVEADDLEGAWIASQNDSHPNPVTDANGQVVGTLQDIVAEQYSGDYDAFGRVIAQRGWNVQPAVWNGKYAQCSTKTGDVFLMNGELHRVAPVGFERIAYGTAVETLLKNLKANRYAINEEFDELLTD